MQEITLTVTIEEANAILALLGEQPTKSGAYPLLIKLKSQGDAQVAPAEETSEEVAE